jgi:uncharacterized protein (TIGR02145 family)
MLINSIWIFSQTPNAFNYQAVLRDASGNIKASANVEMTISILQGSISGTVAYSETQSVTTNTYGLVTIQIGKGTAKTGSFASIDWSAGTFFVKIEVDGTDMGTSQLLSVPYAMYAARAGNYTEIKENIYNEFLAAGMNGLLKDADGNIYKTKKIGKQIWMAENLRTTRYNDGSLITKVTDNTAWKNVKGQGFCWYNNDSVTYSVPYGALYNWYAVSNSKLCPVGWHVATDKEFGILDTLCGTEVSAGAKLKEAGTDHWKTPNTGADNSTGFTGLPGGSRDQNGSYSGLTEIGHYWTSTSFSAANAWLWYFYFSNPTVGHYNNDKRYGYSVRCTKN